MNLRIRALSALAAAACVVVAVGSGVSPAAAAGCPMVSVAGYVSPRPAPFVNWASCNLAGADLSYQNLTGANLTGAILTDADLTGATLFGATLSSATMTGAYATQAEPVTLTLATLAKANLANAFLPATEAADADFSGADLTGANLWGATLHGARLVSATLVNALLPEADLRYANLRRVSASHVGLSGADLSHSTGSEADLSYATANAVKLVDARLDAVDVTHATLTNADARRAYLFLAELGGANLTGADLTGAEMRLVTAPSTTWTSATCSDGKPAGKHEAGTCLLADATDYVAPTSHLAALDGLVAGPSVTVSWTGSDSGAGVGTYDVRYRTSSATGTTLSGWVTWKSAIASKSAALAVSTATRYCFSVRARDALGVPNVGDWSEDKCTVTAGDDNGLERSSGWSTASGLAGWISGSASTATKADAWMSTPPQQQLRRVGVVALRCSACGAVEVYVGGDKVGTISLAAQATERALLTLPAFSSPRSGKVKVVTTSGKQVRIDGILASRYA